jgi:hypothetical protein
MITVVCSTHYIYVWFKASIAEAVNDALEDTVVFLHFSYTWRSLIKVTVNLVYVNIDINIFVFVRALCFITQLHFAQFFVIDQTIVPSPSGIQMSFAIFPPTFELVLSS